MSIRAYKNIEPKADMSDWSTFCSALMPGLP